MQQTIVTVVRDGSTPLATYAPSVSLTVPAGTSDTLAFSVIGENGAAKDLTGAVVLFTLKAKATDASPVLARQAVLDNAAGGLGHFVFLTGDTMTIPGLYVYDVQVIWSDGTVDKVMDVSAFLISESVWQDGEEVSVPPSQSPLAVASTYSPAVPSNWAGTPPTSIVAALDRIAAALASLSAKP